MTQERRGQISLSETELDVLRDIRGLLLIIAEPQLAERDKALREKLRELVGRSEKKVQAVLLMDGTRNQAAIVKEALINQGNLSTLVKSLRDSNLLTGGENPSVIIPVSESMFQEGH